MGRGVRAVVNSYPADSLVYRCNPASPTGRPSRASLNSLTARRRLASSPATK